MLLAMEHPTSSDRVHNICVNRVYIWSDDIGVDHHLELQDENVSEYGAISVVGENYVQNGKIEFA